MYRPWKVLVFDIFATAEQLFTAFKLSQRAKGDKNQIRLKNKRKQAGAELSPARFSLAWAEFYNPLSYIHNYLRVELSRGRVEQINYCQNQTQLSFNPAEVWLAVKSLSKK